MFSATSVFLCILFFVIQVNSQSCLGGTCPTGLTCCQGNIQCYNANDKICCGSLICDKGSTCDVSTPGYSSCTSTSDPALSDGAIAGIIIALIVLCCCIPIGVFLCCFGGLAMMQRKNNQPPSPPSQQPVYVINQPPPGQPVYATNLPPGYVQGQGVPPSDVNVKLDHVGVASAPNM